MARIDLSSGLRLSGDAAGMNTSVLRNWRVETPDGAEVTPNVPRKPISAADVDGLTDPVNGLFRFKNQMLATCEDGFVYRVSDVVPDLAVPLTFVATGTSYLDGGRRPVFAEDPSDAFMAAGGRILKWTPGDVAAAHITSSNAPTNATHICVIGQRLISNDLATDAKRHQFFFTDLGDGSDSSWGSGLNNQVAEARPDEIVALYENTSELFVFGASTLQVYGIGTDPVAPFSQANTLNVGLYAVYSPTRVDDRFAFIDNRRRIVMSDGRQVEVISDDIESWLRANDIEDAWGWRETSDRWDILFFHFAAARRTLGYNLKTKAWFDESRFDGAVTREMPIGAYAYRESDNVHLYGSSIASAIYQRSTSAGTDRGTDVVVCERMTGVHRFDSYKRKRSNRIRCVLRRGTSGPSGSADVLEVRVRDDGEDWSEWEQVSIGNDGDQIQYVDVFLGGVFVGRQYHFRYAGTDDTALIEAHDEVQELDT